MNESDRAAIVTIAETLGEETQRLSMAQTVQGSAYLALARRLAVDGLLDLEGLAKDLETMGETQPDEGWQAGHVFLANGLRLVNNLPSVRKK